MESDSDTQFRPTHIAPSIHVSSDTDVSLADSNEPSTSSGHRGRRRNPVDVNVRVYDVAGEEYMHSNSTHSAMSDAELTPDMHLLNKASVTADHLTHIDSLSLGVLSRRESTRVRGIKYIDDTPRGISDTARSSFVPAHVARMNQLPEENHSRMKMPSADTAYDPFRRSSYALSDTSSPRSMERGLQIQTQLHKLVSAFHERARKVKEQVVTHPPSPTFSLEEEDLQVPDTTIPLHQMPVHPKESPGPQLGRRTTVGSIPKGSLAVTLWYHRIYIYHPFEPQSSLYITWLFIVSLAFMYNACAIPLRAAFDFQTPENIHWWFLGDYFCDLLYLVDIFLFKTSVKFVSNGVWVENRKEIIGRYFHSWRFKLDVAASMPLDLLYLVPQIGPISLLRLPKLLKLPSYWEFQSRVDQVARSPHLLRVMNSLAYMIWMIHANGCLFYYISKMEGFGINHWVYNTSHPAYLHCFWRSFIVATAVGNAPEPENIYENAYMIFSWLVGVFVFALLIGQIRDIFTQMTYQEDHYQNTVDVAIRYMQNLRLPKELQANVRAWFTYNWEQHKTLDENSLLDGLPKKLKTDLVLCVHYNTLSKVQLFQGTDQSLLRDLVLKLKPVVFLPQDFICKKGEVGKEMYIVRSGYLEVMTSDGKVVATLSEGSVFGEISLLSLAGGNRRTADVRSKGFSNLYVLRKTDLHEVLRDYPETQEALKKKAQRLYQQITPTNERKLYLPVEVIKSRNPTPEFVRTVIHVMDPRSSLTKRLSKTAETFTDVADVIAESSSEEIYRVEPVEKAEHFSTTNPSSSRSGSAEYTRRRREQELQRRLSSDTENASETHLAPTRRRRRSRTPNRPKSPNGDSTPTKITKNRDKSPAPLAKIESDDTASDKKSPGLSFLPNFLAGTFRRFFNRPKIGPVTNSNDDSSEHVELSWAKKPPLKRVQVFRLPNVNAADGVGSSPPSVSSTSDENYNNLHLKPPDLESEHSSDPDVVVSKMISESTKSK